MIRWWCQNVLTSAQGVAVPPSPVPTAALHHRHREVSTPIASIRQNPAINHLSSRHLNSEVDVQVAPQHVQRHSPLRIEPGRDTAQAPLISTHDFPSDVADSATRSVPGRLTPELDEAIDGQYLGPTSAQSFLDKALRRLDHDPVQTSAPRREGHVETEILTLSFGDAKVQQPDIAKFSWPEHRTATRLLERFFEFASPTYRYFHEPSVLDWLERIYNKTVIAVAAQACILFMFASASVFAVDRSGDTVDANSQGWESSEMYYQQAEALLTQETGPPRLESVQARFAAVQYLLSSSRPTRGLFAFGTMVQVMQAVGSHRKRSKRTGRPGLDSIAVEVHRRLFWCAFTLDKYLSIVMGRIPLLRVDDTNQALPTIVNDEDLTPEGIRRHTSGPGRDSLLHATRAHVEIGLILARASQEQNRLPTITGRAHIEAAIRGSQDIRDWQSELPPMMSGAIHPGSLIPCFRRQHSILTLARLHAVIFVTRPLLLRDLSNELSGMEVRQYHEQLRLCIRAAREAVESINGSARYQVLYPAFWFSQYVAFSAMSIIHIYIIQMSRHRISKDLFDQSSNEANLMHPKALYELARVGQSRLAEAGVNSAPVWRYGPILESLSAQTSKYIASQMGNAAHENTELVPQTNLTSSNRGVEQNAGPADQERTNPSDQMTLPSLEMDATWSSVYENLWDDLMVGTTDNNNLTMDFWPQFDLLPIGMD